MSTIPKLSPPSEGATEAAPRATPVSAPPRRGPRAGRRRRGRSPAGGRASAPRGDRRPRDAGARPSGVHARPGAQEHGQPLARLVPPDEDDVAAPPARIGRQGQSTPFGITRTGRRRRARRSLVRPPRLRSGSRSAWPDPQKALPIGYQPRRSPAEWHVATGGHGAVASANEESRGASGSCTCTTSKRSRSKILRMRTMAGGLRMRLGSEAFAGTITERPTGTHSRAGALAALLRVEEVGEAAGRVVSHDDLRVDSQRLQRTRLVVGVLLHASPERPRIGDDDPDLHPPAHPTRPRLIRLAR